MPKQTASHAIDASSDAAPPLNFAFKCLLGFRDSLDEVPRPEQGKVKKSPQSGKYKTKSIRFNNNLIIDYKDFEHAMDSLLENPCGLQWLDLSFNDISTIDQVLLNYPSLRTIYLHGNCIEEIIEIEKLAGLPNLKTVSLHGNPIESVKGYKNYILSTLPQIQNLDFTTITKADRETSYEWNKKFGKRFKKKAKKSCVFLLS